jgi:hypothetical protein
LALEQIEPLLRGVTALARFASLAHPGIITRPDRAATKPVPGARTVRSPVRSPPCGTRRLAGLFGTSRAQVTSSAACVG